MISLFLHLNEVDDTVIKAVKVTLLQLAPLMQSQSLAAYVGGAICGLIFFKYIIIGGGFFLGY